MGFGPKAPDPQTGVQAVIDLISLLYPKRATPSVRYWLQAICEPLLTARAPLSFDTINRFLSQPDFRRHILENPGISEKWRELWPHYPGVVDPLQLDGDLAWLIHDRLTVLNESMETPNFPEKPDGDV